MALKYDIMFALKEIQKFNRNLIDVNDLITAVAKHLLIRQTKDNLDQIKDHLMASVDEDGNIPVDADLMRELLKMTKSNMNETKYKAPKDLEKSQKPSPRKDLKDYTVEDKDEKMNPNSTGEKQKNVLRKTDKEVIDNGSLVPDLKDADRTYKPEGEHDPKHAAKVMSKRQDDDEKDSEDSIKDKIENLTREQKERLVREMIRRRIKAVLKEQEEPEEEPAPELEAPAEEPVDDVPAAAPAPTPEEPAAAEPAPAEEPVPAAAAADNDQSDAKDINIHIDRFVDLLKTKESGPEQIKTIIQTIQRIGTFTDDNGNKVVNSQKLKQLYSYLKMATNKMLQKYS